MTMSDNSLCGLGFVCIWPVKPEITYIHPPIPTRKPVIHAFLNKAFWFDLPVVNFQDQKNI